MIHWLKGDDIDAKKWDACVRSDPGALLYGLHWYLDLVCREWEALVLDDYRAVMPLAPARKYGFSYLFRPIGIQQMGIFSGETLNEEEISQFLKVIPAKYKLADLFLNESNRLPGFLPPEWRVEECSNYVIDLGKSYEDIRKAYSKRARRSLKKALRREMNLFEYDGPEELVRMFRANRGGETSSIGKVYYRRMLHLMYVLLHKRRGFLWTVHDERNTAMAAIFIAVTGRRMSLLFSASSAEGKENSAMTWLLDKLFRRFAGSGILFDFEGSDIPGLAAFFAGFGSERRTYYHVRINRLPLILRWIKK